PRCFSSARGGGGQPRADDILRARPRACLAGHGAEEVVPFHCEEARVLDDANGGCARNVAEQRDLARERRRLLELVTLGQLDCNRPGLENVETVAVVALSEEVGAGRELDLCQARDEVLE